VLVVVSVYVLLKVILNLLPRGFCSLIDHHVGDVLNYECGHEVVHLLEALHYKPAAGANLGLGRLGSCLGR